MTVFVILHYKVFEETKNCINSILKLNGDKKIVVVDNNSPNDSGRLLLNEYKNNNLVDIIINKENLGFACGNNIGYLFAKNKYNPDYIVVMNNDMEIQNTEFISGIDKCHNEYNFDIMAPDVFSTKKHKHQNPDKITDYSLDELKKIKKQIQFKLKFKFLLKLKSFFYNKAKSKHKNQEKETPFVNEVKINVPLHGSFYVFDSKFISTHNECFYNKTFMYMESQILYHRAKIEGLKMIYYPFLQVLHHEDVATNSTFKSHYKKAVFTNECLLKSCNAYIELLESENKVNEQ